VRRPVMRRKGGPGEEMPMEAEAMMDPAEMGGMEGGEYGDLAQLLGGAGEEGMGEPVEDAAGDVESRIAALEARLEALEAMMAG
jgi:hypothetical protein